MKTATVVFIDGTTLSLPNFEGVFDADFGESLFVRIVSSKRNDYFPLHTISSITVVDE